MQVQVQPSTQVLLCSFCSLEKWKECTFYWYCCNCQHCGLIKLMQSRWRMNQEIKRPENIKGKEMHQMITWLYNQINGEHTGIQAKEKSQMIPGLHQSRLEGAGFQAKEMSRRISQYHLALVKTPTGVQAWEMSQTRSSYLSSSLKSNSVEPWPRAEF